MTFIPTSACFGVGGNVTAVTLTTNAAWGSGNSSATLAQSPDFSTGETSTETFLGVR
jgi:hypothetical protein